MAFVPSLAAPEEAFAKELLTPAEFGLYQRMDVRDRHHACLVARLLLREEPSASSELLRAALLHDVGKCARQYHPLARIAAHLYTPRCIPPTPRYRGIKGVWQLHRHHGRYGAEMILAAGGSARVAELVARHHDPDGDPEAALLRRIDARF